MQSFLLKAGYVATLTTDANSVSKYSIIKDPSNDGVGPVDLSASAATLLGPYTKDKRIKIDEIGSPVVISIEFLNGALYIKNDDPENNIAEVDDSGELLAIPNTIAAVNSILELLVAKGLMVAPE